MGLNGFFAYDGYVLPIPCDVQDYVFGSLNRANAYKITAFLNAAFGEATWFYPSAGAANNDRYVTYNTRERHWTFGTLARSAGVSFAPGVSVGPVLLGSDGTIYDHETGNARGGAAAFVESGPVEIGSGDTVCSVNRLIPDENNLGEVQLTVYGQYRPMGTEVTYGPFAMVNEPANVRVKARQVRLRFAEVVATAWRVGVMRVGIVLGGRR